METNSTYSQEPSNNPKRNANIVYFLAGIIFLLIGTNVYVILKKNETTQKLVTQTAQAKDEKASMQSELNKMEADLATATNSTKKLTSDLQAKDDELKDKIAQLKKALRVNGITSAELDKAREDIKKLKYFIQTYNQEISKLKTENSNLNSENTSLKTTVDSVSKKSTELASKNEELTKKVNAASALKTSKVDAEPIRLKSSGKEKDVSRAKKTDKIRVAFTVADNDLSLEGSHDIFLQVIGPDGKVLTGAGSGTFKSSSGDDLTYTARTSINYTKANKNFTLEWPKTVDLASGEYKTLLFDSGYKMGDGGFKLK